MLYGVLQVMGWAVFRLLFGLRVRGLRHVPAAGGVILAANHASFLDPPMIGCAVPSRSVSFMAKAELFRVPVFGAFIRMLRAVPVVRGGLTRAQFRQFTSQVRDAGAALTVFPEGTRSPTGALGEPHRGIGAICRHAGVPVIPVLVTGTFEAWPRSRRLPRPFGRIEVRFGAPVEWSEEGLSASGDPSGALATLIMRRIAELRECDEAPAGFWHGYRTLFARAFPAHPRLSAPPASPGGVSRGHGGTSD